MNKSKLYPQPVSYLSLALLAMAIVAAVPIAAFSTVIHVPQDYQTIEEAVLNASDCDTILVAEGTYDGFHYYGSSESPTNITLMGSGWPDGTRIVGDSAGNWLLALYNVRGWRITNFEITQCARGIRCDSLFKCEIDHNYIHGARQGYPMEPYWAVAIGTESLHGMDIHHNLVVDCDHTGFCFQTFFDPGDVHVGVHVYNNTFDGMYYEGIMFKGPGQDPQNCIVTNNIIVNCGGQGLEFAYCDQNDTEVSYNCVYQTAGPWENVDPGPGNIYVSPQFLQEPSIPEYYYLSEESPCIDTGNPDPFYNDPDSSRSDMGAFPLGSDPNIVRLRIAWVEAFPGDTVQVPITISQVTNLGVTSCDLTISYPADDLEFVEVSIPEYSLPYQAGWMLYYDDLGGALRTTVWGETSLEGAGLLAMMTFILDEDAMPGGVWNLAFVDALLNNGAIEVTTSDGGIVFSADSLLYGDVNLSGNVSLLDVSLLFDYLVGETTLNQLQQLLAEVSAQAGITAYDGALITQYCFGQFELFPVEGGSIEMSAEGRLLLPALSTYAGDELEVTVEIENAINVSAAEIEMILGGAPVELIGINIPDERVWFSRYGGMYPGFDICLGGNEALNGHQDILHMIFQVPDTAGGMFSIQLTNIMLNETEITEDVYQEFEIHGSASPDVSMAVAEEFAFAPAHPNPFNPVTKLFFTLPRNCEVSLKIYNPLGQVVDVLESGVLPAGGHQRCWNASQFPSGLYIAELIAGNNRQYQKLLLVK